MTARFVARWRRHFTPEGVDADAGMTTAEYAIGTIAAAAFGAILLVVVKSDAVRAALTSIIESALATR